MHNPFRKIKISLKPNPSFAMIIIKVIGVVMVWRGVWSLLDKYLFPSNHILSAIISIALGFFILYLPDGKIDSLL